MQRSRIRITLLGNDKNFNKPFDLHETSLTPIKNQHPDAEDLNLQDQTKFQSTVKRVLPYLALNEVFIGETLSARVSNLQLRIDNSEQLTKTKCSGLCVSTGTGSTSWLTSINRLTPENVDELLRLVQKDNQSLMNVNPKLISERYNRELVFPPDDPRLCYSIREQICVGVWPNPKGLHSRGFGQNIFIKSRCIDAGKYDHNNVNNQLLELNELN